MHTKTQPLPRDLPGGCSTTDQKEKPRLISVIFVLTQPSLQPDGDYEPNSSWKSRDEATQARGRETLVLKPLLGFGDCGTTHSSASPTKEAAHSGITSPLLIKAGGCEEESRKGS